MKHVLSHLAELALALPRPLKRGIVLALDAGFCVLAVWLAFYLRLGVFQPFSAALFWPALTSVLLALPIFIRTGLYRAIFRYSGLPAMVAMARAMLLYAVVFASIFTFYGFQGVPRTVGLIQPVLLFILVGASRAQARIWLGGRYHKELHKATVSQALVYGAGNAGRQLAAAMSNSPQMRVVGFLDDDERLHGQVLNGLLIYNPADLAEILVDLPVTDVLLALPSVSRQRRNAILDALKPHKVAVRSLPGLSDIAMGKVHMSDVQELDIHDLLGREPVDPNERLLHLHTQNKTVLVTGAGGSIGGELTRQIVLQQPSQLLLFDHNEFGLYSIHQELCGVCVAKGLTVELIPLLGSVANTDRLMAVCSKYRPATVYHAAAYKHVPMVEDNPGEGILNNVFGTLNVAQVAQDCGAARVVLISTDKAVRPTNIMGASKRMAELVLQALTARQNLPTATCFCMVRFGNVLGSSGSVVPLFRQQLSNGGPLTVTHAEVTRYFMTIPEAAQLVLQAGAMARGGDVFVLDMGEPVKIMDLALRMVQLSGLTLRDAEHPQGDIEITVTGLRPGEKLYEELLIGNNPEPTVHPRIMKAHEDFLTWPELLPHLETLRTAAVLGDVYAIKTVLQQCVQGYGVPIAE